jgi:hypothetical protein
MLLTPIWDFYVDSGAFRSGTKKYCTIKKMLADIFFFMQAKPTFVESG